jgi:hypothetical protein
VILDSRRADKSQGPAVDEHAVQDEWRQAERVITVEVSDEDNLDGAGIQAEAVHMRQQWRAAIQQHTSIDDDGPVVAVQRERRTAPEECELYATVTA